MSEQLHCIVNGCPHPNLNGKVEKLSDLEEYEVICKNEYFMHVKSGRKHYEYKRNYKVG